MTVAERDRLDREILDLRIVLAGELPPARQALLGAELQDLRLARLGVSTPRIRMRLDLLGLGPGGQSSRLLWRGPDQWGEDSRVHLS
jgi:hypothetical protein